MITINRWLAVTQLCRLTADCFLFNTTHALGHFVRPIDNNKWRFDLQQELFVSLNLLLAAKQLICIFLFFFSVNPCTIFNDPCRPCLSYLQIYSCLHLSVYECICIKIYTKFAKLGHKNVICDRIRLRLYICLRWMELTAWQSAIFSEFDVCSGKTSDSKLLGPVVRRPISANPGLDFNLGFFIPLL